MILVRRRWKNCPESVQSVSGIFICWSLMTARSRLIRYVSDLGLRLLLLRVAPICFGMRAMLDSFVIRCGGQVQMPRVSTILVYTPVCYRSLLYYILFYYDMSSPVPCCHEGAAAEPVARRRALAQPALAPALPPVRRSSRKTKDMYDNDM